MEAFDSPATVSLGPAASLGTLCPSRTALAAWGTVSMTSSGTRRGRDLAICLRGRSLETFAPVSAPRRKSFPPMFRFSPKLNFSPKLEFSQKLNNFSLKINFSPNCFPCFTRSGPFPCEVRASAPGEVRPRRRPVRAPGSPAVGEVGASGPLRSSRSFGTRSWALRG